MNKLKLLYATKNKSKIYNMRRRLKNLPIELLTPYDLEEKINVREDGKTPSENALKKAQSYYDKLKIPTIAADSGLYIEGLKQEEQPGLFVRRVNNKVLTDEEMIEYYRDLATRLGGEVMAYYLTGLSMITGNGTYQIEIKEDPFILTNKIDTKHQHRGNPLDVITIDPHSHKYLAEMTDEDVTKRGFHFEKECLDFIKKNLNID